MAKCCLCGNNIEIFSGVKFIEQEKICDKCNARINKIKNLIESNVKTIIATRKELIAFIEDGNMQPNVKEELKKIMDVSYEFTSRYMASDYESEKYEVYHPKKKEEPVEIKYTPEQKYEYRVTTVSDSEFLGKISVEDMEEMLTAYARKGWRLHTAFTNEKGKNSVVGVNATINDTVFIFEREVIHEDINENTESETAEEMKQDDAQ